MLKDIERRCGKYKVGDLLEIVGPYGHTYPQMCIVVELDKLGMVPDALYNLVYLIEDQRYVRLADYKMKEIK